MLKSKADAQLPLNFSQFPLLKNTFRNNGGTSLKMFELPDRRIPSGECFKYIIELVNTLKQFNVKSEVDVLAYNRDTIRFLQKEIFLKCSNTEDVLMDTIDRIQGLTTDFFILFILTESIPFALEINRFNVATSRARLCTLIIAAKEILNFTQLNKELSNYFEHVVKDIR